MFLFSLVLSLSLSLSLAYCACTNARRASQSSCGIIPSTSNLVASVATLSNWSHPIKPSSRTTHDISRPSPLPCQLPSPPSFFLSISGKAKRVTFLACSSSTFPPTYPPPLRLGWRSTQATLVTFSSSNRRLCPSIPTIGVSLCLHFLARHGHLNFLFFKLTLPFLFPHKAGRSVSSSSPSAE